MQRPSGSVREFVSTGPFSFMRRLAEELDLAAGKFALRRGGAMWSPSSEVAEHNGRYIVRTQLPGVKDNQLKVDVTRDALSLEGENYTLQIPLPEGVRAEDIRAAFEDGVLEIS